MRMSSTPQARLGRLFNCRAPQSNPVFRISGEEKCAITNLVKAIVQVILKKAVRSLCVCAEEQNLLRREGEYHLAQRILRSARRASERGGRVQVYITDERGSCNTAFYKIIKRGGKRSAKKR